LTIWKNN